MNRYGNLALAGDAARIVPPTGAEGLDLAVGGVVAFVRGLAHGRRTGSSRHLDVLESCLRRVRRAERFGYSLTTALHRDPEATGFGARPDRIATARSAATDLGENRTGLPLPFD